VVFSPDGARLATASSDGTARLWEAATGREQARLEHGGTVRVVVFSPDGARLAPPATTARPGCGPHEPGAAVTEPAKVLISGQISADEAVRIAAEFSSVGLTADLRVAAPRRFVGDVAWLLLAALPLQPFFNRLAEDFADDVHERLKTFVTRVLRRRPAANRPKPVLMLQDTLSGVQVVLEPDLPAESYRQLLSFDLCIVRRGPLHYDLHRRRWRSELDEERTTSPPPVQPDR
jgi:hypothetical protein